AREVGLSPHALHRRFKGVVGVTPKGYAAAVRARRLRDGLRGGGSVARAIYGAGFGSSSRCYEGAAELLGMTPSEYKKGAAGLLIRFAVAPTDLGWVLVAATARGLCAVEFADAPEALRGRLAARFPGAELREGDPDFAARVAEVVALVEAPGRDHD